MINSRFLSRQLESQPRAKNKSILVISNMFCHNDSDLQYRERPVLIDYNGESILTVE